MHLDTIGENGSKENQIVEAGPTGCLVLFDVGRVCGAFILNI